MALRVSGNLEAHTHAGYMTRGSFAPPPSAQTQGGANGFDRGRERPSFAVQPYGVEPSQGVAWHCDHPAVPACSLGSPLARASSALGRSAFVIHLLHSLTLECPWHVGSRILFYPSSVLRKARGAFAFMSMRSRFFCFSFRQLAMPPVGVCCRRLVSCVLCLVSCVLCLVSCVLCLVRFVFLQIRPLLPQHNC